MLGAEFKSLPVRRPTSIIRETAVQAEETESQYRLLLGQIAARSEAALSQFYELTLSRVYGLALRITNDRAAAEEVTEDVYFQVWREAQRYDAARGAVLGWLLTVCRSRALDYLRRREPAELHPEPETLADPALDESDPQDLLLALQQKSKIAQAMAALSAQQRQLLALAFFRGLSHQEIAAHTGSPLGTVKSHIRQALLTLRKLLPEHEI